MKSVKQYVMTVLNGVALGVIVALVPGALFFELVKALSTFMPELSFVSQLLSATNTLVGVSCGFAIGYLLQFTPIESMSIGLATMLAGGAIQFVDGAIVLKGTGDILTIAFTGALAVLLILSIRQYVGGYAILVVPTASVLFAGLIGRLSLPYFMSVTRAIGESVKHLLTLEQTVMSMLIAIVFAGLIVSPISSVGIGIAISISGVGSGAANLGICACGFALAIAGRRVNSIGTCLAHVIGSPKISMPNILAKPKLFVPIAINAGIIGALASLFAIQGTPMSAGFGLSGLVGPVNHLNSVGWNMGNISVAILLFIGVPIILGVMSDYLFVNKLQWIQAEDYRITL